MRSRYATLPRSSPDISTTAASYAVFFDAIAAQGRALLRIALDTTDKSLTPPQAFLTHAQDIRAILALHTAESDDDDNHDADQSTGGATIERALDSLVDPALQMCVHAAEEKDAALRRNVPAANAAATATGWDRPVFVLNCLAYLADTLAPHPCAARKHEALNAQIEMRVRELINEHVRPSPNARPIHFSRPAQYENVLRDSGLHDAVRACESAPPDVMSLLPIAPSPKF